MWVILREHAIRGESRNRPSADREVATSHQRTQAKRIHLWIHDKHTEYAFAISNNMWILVLYQGWPTIQRPKATFLAVTAKSHIIHINHPISSSLTHIPLLTQTYYKYHTPTWRWQNFTSHLLRCTLFFVELLVIMYSGGFKVRRGPRQDYKKGPLWWRHHTLPTVISTFDQAYDTATVGYVPETTAWLT